MTARPHSVRLSAPGSLMLFGEHAVLRGETALCTAVDQRITVTAARRQDRTVTIDSSLGTLQTDLDHLVADAPFTFLVRCLQRADLHEGLDIRVDADFGDRVGLGSSAAVTVATVAAIRELSGDVFDRTATFLEARAVIHDVQGRGSGADVAAACFGGIVGYRAEPLEIEPLVAHPPVSLLYAGYKTPTPDVIRHVDALGDRHPERYRDLFAAIGTCSREALVAIRNGDLEAVGRLMNIHHGLQDALGTCDATLADLAYRLRALPGILGAKISGSGLGDCVLALGRADVTLEGYPSIPVAIGAEGLKREA